MKSQFKVSDKLPNNFPIILILMGIVTYIFVDSGIIDWKLSKSIPPQQTTTEPDQGIIAYSNQLKSELISIEKQVAVEKNSLLQLQKDVKNFEQKMKDHKTSFGQIEKEIEGLTTLKKSITKTKQNINSAETVRAVAAIDTPTAAASINIWHIPPTTIEDVELRINNSTAIETHIEQLNYKEQDYLRLKTTIEYSTESSVFLLESGIRQVHLFSSGTQQLGFDQVTLAYQESDPILAERLIVLKRFINERFGNSLKLKTVRVDPEIQMNTDFEIWMSKSK